MIQLVCPDYNMEQSVPADIRMVQRHRFSLEITFIKKFF